MPLYDYKCSQCGHIFGVQQKISEDPLKLCPKCKGEIKRLISPAGIIFKGSGFHVTDYGKKESKTAKAEAKTDSKPADKSVSQPASKSESKEVAK